MLSKRREPLAATDANVLATPPSKKAKGNKNAVAPVANLPLRRSARLNKPLLPKPDSRDVTHYVVHYHGPCSHPYRGRQNAEDFELSSNFSGRDNDGRWQMPILHPRWCLACATHRGRALDVLYEHRLRGLEVTLGQSERIQKEIAYTEGIRDGRSQALFGSLTQYRQDKEAKEIADGGVGDLTELMEDVEVEPRVIGPVEQDEALSQMMTRGDLGEVESEDGQMGEELKIALEVGQEYEEGVEEGRRMQAELEW